MLAENKYMGITNFQPAGRAERKILFIEGVPIGMEN